MTGRLRRLTDGVLPQALITGSLSFAHIHDLALTYGQTGWKAWTYPLSVDLLTVAAYRKMIDAHRSKRSVFLPWVCFLMALAASLAANVIATGGHDVMSIAVGVWPAVAFLGCTLLGHTQTDAIEPVAVAVAEVASTSTEIATAPEVKAVAAPVVTTSPVPFEPFRVPVEVAPPVAPDLLEYASRVARDHQAKNGFPITVAALRDRLGVSPTLANAVHTHLTAAQLAA